jgi:hypothetical protein
MSTGDIEQIDFESEIFPEIYMFNNPTEAARLAVLEY